MIGHIEIVLTEIELKWLTETKRKTITDWIITRDNLTDQNQPLKLTDRKWLTEETDCRDSQERKTGNT